MWSSLCGYCVALVVSFYWGRVVKLVIKTRKQTGRSAHLLPPEPLGRFIRIVWYPTVCLWIATPWLVAAGVSLPGLHPLYDVPAVQIPAAIATALVLHLTMICWRRMGRDWRMGIDPDEKNNLIVSGPYSRVRHPIYALQIALVWLSFIAVPVPMLLGVGLLQSLFLTWEAVREEQHLTTQHGDLYRTYMRGTGRFLPRLRAVNT